MSTVLEILINNPGNFLSGEAIAHQLSMTRANVWKEIKKLRHQGIEIESISNRGYRLVSAHHVLIPELMQTSPKSFDPIYTMTSIDSTNLEAKRQLPQHKHNFMVVANHQTAGKGRKGRTFYSPENRGVYASFVIYPEFTSEYIQLVTLAAAVSVCETLEILYELEPKIKWQNDIYLGNKKVCGILTEGEYELELQRFTSVVIGVGMNIFQAESIPQEIERVYTAISEHSKIYITHNAFMKQLSERLQFWLKDFPQNQKTLVSAYRRRNLVLYKQLTIVGEEHRIYRALDIDDFGQLIVENVETHEQRILNANEISIGAFHHENNNT